MWTLVTVRRRVKEVLYLGLTGGVARRRRGGSWWGVRVFPQKVPCVVNKYDEGVFRSRTQTKILGSDSMVGC